MSTPIEIVRDCHAWRRGEGKYAGDGFIPPVNIMPPYWMCQESDALASVLRDAERVAELEAQNARLREAPMQALGFAYSWACQALDAGNDPRLLEVPLLKDAWDKAQAALADTKGTP